MLDIAEVDEEPDVRNVATYAEGEDSTRLARAARYLGLLSSDARTPQRPVRQQPSSSDELHSTPHKHGEARTTAAFANSIVKFGSTFGKNVGLIFSDSTLEAARMHSVGVTAKEERVAGDGTLHLMTLSRRKRGEKKPADYGDLMDLFHQEPLEYEVRPSEEEDYEEVVLDTVEGGSIMAAVFGIIKGTVGPAILYLPRGFQLSGYAVAIPSMLVATASYLYSARRLLQCWKVESMRSHLMAAKMEEIRQLLDPMDATGDGAPAENYGSTANKSVNEAESSTTTKLLTYPELARRAFGGFSVLVTFGIAAMQFGVCLTYLIFVPQNLVEATLNLTGLHVPKLYFLISMVAIEIPLSWIRDIRKLTPLNILATMLIAYGLASCLIMALFFSKPVVDEVDGVEVSNLFQKIARLPALNDTWYLFIGTSFFVFEGSITLLVPLQEAVYRREDKEKFPDVNQKVTSGIVIFYIIFAITCWASFGDSVKTALTASLPEGGFATSVQFAYSIAVIFTFPLQAFPALEVVCHTTGKKTGGASQDKTILKRDAVASVIVCALGVVAVVAIDFLGNVVSLLGSFVGIPIALIYPPLMHNRLVKDSSRSTRILNYSVAFVGVLATFAASFTTIVSWDKGAEG